MDLEPTLIFEDNHLLAVHKPPGLLSQGDVTGDASVVTWVGDYLKRTYNKPGAAYVALLHRLDRPVGGVLLLAKTGKAAARLSAQFQAHSVQKTYLVVAERPPAEPAGTLNHFLAKLPGKNIVRAYDTPAYGAQPAELHYRLLATAPDGKALIAINPITGRQHQIRVQLARIGCVVAGDVKYGKTAFLPDKSIALFAHTLTVDHPTLNTPLCIVAWPKLLTPWFAFSEQLQPGSAPFMV